MLASIFDWYPGFVKFLREKVTSEKDANFVAAHETLDELPSVSHLAKMILLFDITDLLKINSKMSQADVLIVVQLETINKQLFADLTALNQTKTADGNKYKFGEMVTKDARDIEKGVFMGAGLKSGPAKKSRDMLSPPRNQIREFCLFLKPH